MEGFPLKEKEKNRHPKHPRLRTKMPQIHLIFMCYKDDTRTEELQYLCPLARS